MALLKKRRILLAKLESVNGTGVTLTSGTDAMINAYDVSIEANIPHNERVSQGAFGRLAGTVGAYAGTLKFKIEAYGSGAAGTAPAWALVLLEACGMAHASGVFSPSTASATQHSATIAVYEDGIRKELTGAMGTWSFSGEDGKTADFEFEFKGVWTAPTDVALATPQFATVIPPRFAGATLTIGAYTPTASKVSIKYGNKVEMREDVTQVSGYIASIITDRKVTGTVDPEATLIATYDAFGIWLAGTTAAFTCTIGSSGTGLSIVAPVIQYDGVKEADRNGKIVHDLSFVACQNSSTVDTEITITF